MEERIEKVFNDVFKEIVDFSMELNRETENRWDSLKHIQLLSSIEEAFRIEIQFEDAIEMITGESILTKVKKYITKDKQILLKDLF